MRIVGGRCHRKRLFFRLEGFTRGSIYKEMKIKESQKVILLGLAIYNGSIFKEHIDNYRSTSYKLHGMCRIQKYLTLDNTKLPYSAFVNSISLVMPP